MQFTDHELMFMFDAAAQHAANPLFDDMPEVEVMYLAVAEKCQAELIARGYARAGQTTYTV